jgi:hypothetical protein
MKTETRLDPDHVPRGVSNDTREANATPVGNPAALARQGTQTEAIP